MGDSMDKSATQWMIEPLRKYATFSGRARRKEYWWFALFTGLVSMVCTIGDFIIMGADEMFVYGGGPLLGIASLALILPSLAVTVRRLHDRDRSGWFILLGLLPLVGVIILFIWYVSRGTIGDNRFGPDPLAGEA